MHRRREFDILSKRLTIVIILTGWSGSYVRNGEVIIFQTFHSNQNE